MQCPRKFQLKYIAKAFKEEEKSIHLIKGTQIHKQLEDYVLAKKGQIIEPPGYSPEVKQALPLVDRIMGAYEYVHPEAQVACDVNWKPTEWFGKNTAWRAIFDLSALNETYGLIGDYKSGKVYNYTDECGQLHLSSCVALNRFDKLEYVDVAYFYVEHKKTEKIRITRDELPAIQSYFDGKYAEVQAETEWKPKVNEFCKWCPATQKQCPFSRKL